MTDKMTTKVRLVRCPRCRLVLPELAEVPVYSCGGCGAVLQAKVRKTDANDGPTSNIIQAGPTPKPTPEPAPEEIKASNSNQQSTIVSSDHAGTDQCDSTDSVKEQQPGYINHSGDPRSSTDISSPENPDSSPEGRALIDSDTETCHADQDDTRDQNACSDSDKEKHGGDINMSDEIFSSPSPDLNYLHESQLQSPSVQREVDDDDDESNCSLDEENDGDGDELEDSSRELPAELISHEDTEVKENLTKGSAFRSLIADKLLDSRPRKLASTSQSLVDDDVERSRSNKFQGFEYTGSGKVLESARFNKPRSDLGVPNGGMSKSPTGRSYNAYDGSVSSFEGNDDQVARSHLPPRRRNYGVGSKELPKGDDFRGNLGRNQNAMNRGKWDHEIPGPMRNGHPIRDMNDARSRVPFHERGSRARHGESSTSTLGFSDFQYNSMYHSPAKPDDTETEKMELLRMVRQLQDQLDRSNLLKGNPSGVYPPRVAMKENQMSPYYHLAAEREMHHDLNYSRYPGQYGQGKSWSHQFQPARTAFSGDPLHNRSQIECSCFHCYSQERHYSAQLPPREIYNSKGHYGNHHYSPYQSDTSSPQHHTGSEYSLWDHETRSNDQRLRKDRDMKNRHPPKQHFRPVAGGSPMVACYLCTATLQLPADFLLFRRRYHSLKCNACSKILKFSLQKRSHLVPYVPESENIAPPPSEVDEYPDPNKARILKSVPRTIYDRHAASSSYSDDYGRAYSKDYSAETDAPFDQKMSSVSSSDPTVDRKKKSVMQNLRNHSVQSYSGHSRFSSKKTSSEIEEVEETRATSGSPLHRLMGYASPSKVIRGD